jgi:hypothetical protein
VEVTQLLMHHHRQQHEGLDAPRTSTTHIVRTPAAVRWGYDNDLNLCTGESVHLCQVVLDLGGEGLRVLVLIQHLHHGTT